MEEIGEEDIKDIKDEREKEWYMEKGSEEDKNSNGDKIV